MMIVVGNNFCRNTDNRTASANRALEGFSLFRALLLKCFCLFAFGCSLVNICTASITAWPADDTVNIVLIARKILKTLK